MNQQIVINNQLISYWHNETAGNVCLLFLHGWRSQKEVWDSVVLRIKDKGLGIYTIDLPGFGGSPAPHGSWSVGDYAEVVKGFIEKLELKTVIIIGHSFGGRVAIKLASEYSGVASKLVLVDSAGFVMQSSRKEVMATAAKIVRPLFKPKFMQNIRRKIYKGIGAEDYLATPELQKTFINIVNEDLDEDMKRIKIPTLIIWGENDKETPVEYGKRMGFLIPNAEFLILKNAGHFSFLDKPEEFAKALQEFINTDQLRRYGRSP